MKTCYVTSHVKYKFRNKKSL